MKDAAAENAAIDVEVEWGVAKKMDERKTRNRGKWEYFLVMDIFLSVLSLPV